MIVRRMEPVMEMDRLLHMHTIIAYTAPEQSLSGGKSSGVRAHTTDPSSNVAVLFNQPVLRVLQVHCTRASPSRSSR